MGRRLEWNGGPEAVAMVKAARQWTVHEWSPVHVVAHMSSIFGPRSRAVGVRGMDGACVTSRFTLPPGCWRRNLGFGANRWQESRLAQSSRYKQTSAILHPKAIVHVPCRKYIASRHCSLSAVQSSLMLFLAHLPSISRPIR